MAVVALKYVAITDAGLPSKCLEHRGLLFLDELYQHTPIPGTNLPIPLDGFDRKGELFDVILMSAWSAFNLKKPVYLDFLWKNVEYLTIGSQHLRSTLASDLDASLLRKLYSGIAPKFQEESAFECMKALHAIARLSGVEAGPLPKGVAYGCANYSCRAFCLTRGGKRKAEMFQTCAGCKKVLYLPPPREVANGFSAHSLSIVSSYTAIAFELCLRALWTPFTTSTPSQRVYMTSWNA
ncbi:hypothetical protein PQX77_009788 [Marasmius sp. AFHP31]|nr:hypothetical protein PQX77_009788 [Marasmius sp. AFHP31]